MCTTTARKSERPTVSPILVRYYAYDFQFGLDHESESEKKSAVFSCFCSTPTIPTPQGIRNPTTPHKEIALSIPTRKSLGRCTHLGFAQANKETLDQVLLQHSTRPLEGERKSTHNSQSGECVYMQPVSGFQYNQTSRGGVMGLYAKWTR